MSGKSDRSMAIVSARKEGAPATNRDFEQDNVEESVPNKDRDAEQDNVAVDANGTGATDGGDEAEDPPEKERKNADGGGGDADAARDEAQDPPEKEHKNAEPTQTEAEAVPANVAISREEAEEAGEAGEAADDVQPAFSAYSFDSIPRAGGAFAWPAAALAAWAPRGPPPRGCAGPPPAFEGGPAACFADAMRRCYATFDARAAMVDDHGHRIASQIAFSTHRSATLAGTGAEACTQLALAARCTRGKGSVVEFGTWAGHSTRCLGLGLNATGVPGRLFGFDNFVAGGGNWPKFKDSPFYQAAQKGKGAYDILPVFYRYVRDKMYPSAVAKRGNFHKIDTASVWRHKPVSLFTTDAAKGFGPTVLELGRVAPYLTKGALLVFADLISRNNKAGWIPLYLTLVPHGYIRLLSVSPTTSHATYAVLKSLDRPGGSGRDDAAFRRWWHSEGPMASVSKLKRKGAKAVKGRMSQEEIEALQARMANDVRGVAKAQGDYNEAALSHLERSVIGMMSSLGTSAVNPGWDGTKRHFDIAADVWVHE